MFRKLPLFILSLAMFIALLTLFVLQITGKSDLLLFMFAEYLGWVKHGQFFLIFIVFVLASFGSSYLITFGIFLNIVSDKKGFTTKIFWFFFVFFLIIQLMGIYLQRVHKVG